MAISTEDKRAIATVYGACVAHLCHLDRQAWSFVPIMVLAQSLMLPAAYALRKTPLVYVVMAVLIIFMFIALGLYNKLCADRDVNLKLMDAMTNELLVHELKQDEWKNRYGSYISYSNENWRWHPLGLTLRAREIMQIAFWLLVALDLALVAAAWKAPNLLDTPAITSQQAQAAKPGSP